MKLDRKAFALTAALIAGGISLILNILSVITGFAADFFLLIAPFHPGYTHTIPGALISAIWMCIYGYVLGAVFALVYNAFAKK